MSARVQARSFTSTSKSLTFRAGRPPHHRRSEWSEKSRGAGWDFVHVCIDDHSRVAFSEIKPDEAADSRSFLSQAGCGLLQESRRHRPARHDRQWQLRPVLRLPRRLPGAGHHAYPHQALHAENKRKGRALHSDRLRECAYAKAYPTSDRRIQQLPVWLHQYNSHRPHGGINSQTSISRLGLTEDNLLRLHS
jgi:hypothetical protein